MTRSAIVFRALLTIHDIDVSWFLWFFISRVLYKDCY